MTTTTVTLTGDVSDLIGNDYDPSRTKVWVQHNTDKVVTDSGPIRLGAATKPVASDGTFSFANVVASTSMVENLQATLWVDWPNAAGPQRERKQAAFGPYDLTGLSGTVDIRSLEQAQALDPVASSALLSEMRDLRDEQVEISGIDSTDTAVAYAVQHGATTPGVLSASFGEQASTDGTPLRTAIQGVVESAGVLQRVPRVPEGTVWFDTFGAGNDWYDAWPHIVSDSPDVQLFSDAGLKYGPSTVQDDAAHPYAAPINLTGKQIVVALKALDGNSTGLGISLGNADFSAYGQSGIAQQCYRPEDGWVMITVQPLAVGGTPLSTFQQIRFRFQTALANHTAYIGAIGTAPNNPDYPNGVVMIDLDDSDATHWTIARPILRAAGMPASVLSIGDASDVAGINGMSVANLHLLEDVLGWKVGAHSRTYADHVDLTTLTGPQVESNILRTRQWLTANGFEADYYAYPFGASNEAVRASVKRYFNLGRGVGGFGNITNNPPILDSTRMTLPAIAYDASVQATILSQITATAANKAQLTLVFHGLTGQQANFEAIVAAIESAGCAVVTPTTLYGLAA